MLTKMENALYHQILDIEATLVTSRLFYFFIIYGLIFLFTFIFLISTLNKLSKFYKSSLEVFGWVKANFA